MKIGIDVFGCNHGQSGNGSYISSFIKNISNLQSDYEIELFGPEIDRFTYTSGLDNISYQGFQIDDISVSTHLWHVKNLKKFIKKQQYDLVIYPSPGIYLPNTKIKPYIVIVNEILSEKWSSKSFFNFSMKNKLKKATRIIASSSFIKKDLQKMNISQKKIDVVHIGIDHSLFFPRSDLTLENNTVLVKPFAIKQPYIVYASKVSHLYKKHIELIRAFSLFKEKTNAEHRLVMVGEEGEAFETIQQELKNCPYASDIFLTGYFPHQNMPELYACADFCVFPSVAEGVGLPVLEAMATGTATAIAKAGALPEIAGDNALYFNSEDIESISCAMETMYKNKTIKEKIIEGGFEWTKRFSWDKTVNRIFDIIKTIIK